MSVSLDEALKLWRETGDPLASEFADRLTPGLTKPLYPKSASNELRQARWLAAARDGAPLGALLETLGDAFSESVIERLQVLDAWPDDPRITSALVRLWEKPAHLNVSTRPVWEAIGRRLATRADLRAQQRLDAIAALGAPWTQLFRPHMRPVIPLLLDATRRAVAVAVASRPRRPLTAAERRALAPPVSLDTLLQAVFSTPEALERRLVYADALIEAGDPRGEFIALQCGVSTPATRRRASKLLSEHEPLWSKPFAAIGAVSAWEHGFPAAVTVTTPSRLRLAPLFGHPAWATVHTLSTGGHTELLIHPAMTRVRHVKGVTAQELRALSKLGRPFPFTTLTTPWVEPGLVKVLCSSDAFPALAELRLPPRAERQLEAELTRLATARPSLAVRFGSRSAR